MLVLSRKLDETIIIGEDIRIKVVALKGGSVRLGIEAPPNVTIRREELEEVPNRSYSSSLTGSHSGYASDLSGI